MIPKELSGRRRELQAVLGELSGSAEFVSCERTALQGGDAVTFSANVRIRSAGLRFKIWEEFRDIDSDPFLYAFGYKVADEKDVNSDEPLFRYECHPDVGDKIKSKKPADGKAPFRSPYEKEPHFHPDRTNQGYLKKLHYPFHRNERKSVIFALVQWLRVDLIRRFHHD